MRKTCAHSGVWLSIFSLSFGVFGFVSLFILNLFTQFRAGFSQLPIVFTQTAEGVFTDVGRGVSTVSTGLITTTTFYLNDSLTTSRGIS